MGKGTLSTELHPTHFKILVVLSSGDNTSYGISKILKMSQSNIFTQMEVMQGNLIFKKTKYEYSIDYQKLILSFLNFIKDLTNSYTREQFDKLPINNLSSNKYLKFIFKEAFSAIGGDIDRIKPKTTLSDFFDELIYFLQWSFQDIYKNDLQKLITIDKEFKDVASLQSVLMSFYPNILRGMQPSLYNKLVEFSKKQSKIF